MARFGPLAISVLVLALALAIVLVARPSQVGCR